MHSELRRAVRAYDADASAKTRLAVLNEKMTAVERNLRYAEQLEARITPCLQFCAPITGRYIENAVRKAKPASISE
jgi:hypothetical protein